MSLKTNCKRNLLLTSTAVLAMANMMYAPMANAIVPTDEVGPEDAVDNEGGVNGVGQFFSNGGLCTGTLINARTVLFAAHCVNTLEQEAYGASIPAAFSFNVDGLPGLQNWFQSGFQTNTDLNVFNVNQIFWNSDSIVNPASRGFIEGDIALASLDTPAANIPTWALLFSALPAPDALTNESGTGYHVNITGYGGTGDGGLTGDNLGIDFRRRAAENYLGGLSSLNQRNEFIFGSPEGGPLPQNLYWIDFDSPNGDTFSGDPFWFEFNPNLDQALPNEGITAGGDSGGPLILDAANNDITDIDIIIGVLSGGSRFFGGQPPNSFGTQSFYQPLFAFYDYIAANNPYRYVSALEGDGNWEDGSHWVTETDPAYFIFDENNALVNGIPDTPEEGINATDGDFGAICFQPFANTDPGECIDTSTDEIFSTDDLSDGANAVEGDDQAATLANENNALQLDADVLSGLGLTNNNIGSIDSLSLNQTLDVNGLEDVAISADLSTNTLVAEDGDAVEAVAPVVATIDNGRAGATDFVPNNVERDDATGTSVRYFDVTLAAAGTTTLSSDVEIDRLTINGPSARLNVAESGSLTSLIDIEQINGWVDVNGQITSVGDYLLMSGMLTGSGTLKAPFFTNIMGGIAPGGMGEIGTLTIDGSAILASASGLMIDLGTNGVNDVLAITGDASLGGTVGFNPTAPIFDGDEFTFVSLLGTDTETEDGTVTTFGTLSGEFSNASTQLTPLLTAVLSYDETSVTAKIEAGSFLDVIEGGNAVQQSYASLLDNGRGAASLAPIFATLDLSSEEAIQDVLDSWAPVAETTVRSLAKTTTEQTKRFHRSRMDAMASGNWGGKMTMMGTPLQMASNTQYASVMSDIGYLQANNGAPIQTTANIPSDYEVYLSGAFVDGKGGAMPTEQNFADEDFDGFAINGGIEKLVTEKFSVGASVSYTSLEAEAALNQIAETEHVAGTIYGQIRSDHNITLDGQLSYGDFNSKTARTVAFPSNATLTTDDDSKTFGGELRVSKSYSLGEAQVVPRASLTYTSIDFEKVSEAGGLPGLTVNRNDITSTQGRVGLAIKSAPNATVRLTTHADYVTELGNVDDSFEANFVGLNTPTSSFAVFGTDESWGEIGASLSFDVNAMTVNVSADTTVARKDIEARTVRAGLSWKF